MVMAPKLEVEMILFIKTYINLLTAISFTVLYAKLCDILQNSKQVFYVCVILFLIFFSSFAFLVYPNTAALYLHAFIDKIANHLPLGLVFDDCYYS
jgi:AAA family ATP:ADP antiporter